ncbi:MAG: response regulator transcription factor [Dehalococcoidia bacterium]
MTTLSMAVNAERILFLYAATPGVDAAVRMLRSTGLTVMRAPVAVTASWPETAIDAAVVRSDSYGETAITAAQRLKAAQPRAPLVLWAPYLPLEHADALQAGYDVWLPDDAPTAALVAQLQAFARLRSASFRDAHGGIVTVRGVTIDFGRHSVAVNDTPAPLTPTEYRILAFLGRSPGRTVTHLDLYREMHGSDGAEQDAKDAVKVHLSRLRSKLIAAGAPDDIIITVRGFGYRLERRGPDHP